jgi:DNA recombination-dependent growth factor C
LAADLGGLRALPVTTEIDRRSALHRWTVSTIAPSTFAPANLTDDCSLRTYTVPAAEDGRIMLAPFTEPAAAG